MNRPSPLQTLAAATVGEKVPLPPTLAAFHGPLRLEALTGRPLVIANFVETLDGVVALDKTPRGGSSAISGGSVEDRALMGLLRALADVVVVGAGTQRAVPRHRWTAARIYPPFADAYAELRQRLGKPPVPLNVVVSARGSIEPDRPIFRSGELPVLVVTTPEGAARLRPAVSAWPSTTRLVVASENDQLSAQDILDAIHACWPARVVLVEGGPRLLGDFLAERCLDELFLTLAPQVAGRDAISERHGLVAGRTLAPTESRWADLISIQRAASHLFLRYAFRTGGGEE